MAHWTEPEHRLNWDRINEGYAMGELIAEFLLVISLPNWESPTASESTNQRHI
jgi:hypothetical protein